MNYAALSQAIQDYTQNYESNFVANIPVFVQQTEERIYNTVQLPPLRKNVTGKLQTGNKYLSSPEDFLSVFSLATIDGDGNFEYLLNKDVNFLRAAYPKATDTGAPKYYALFGPTVASGDITNELSFIIGPTPDSSYDVELHYYYYPLSIVSGIIKPFGLGFTNGGSYIDGTYTNVPFYYGDVNSTPDVFATVNISGGSIQYIQVTSGGAAYLVGEKLTAYTTTFFGGDAIIGIVTDIYNPSGTSWLGDNYSPALLYGSLVEAYTFMKGEQDMMTYYQTKFQEALSQLNRLGTGLERGDAYRDGQAKIKVNP